MKGVDRWGGAVTLTFSTPAFQPQTSKGGTKSVHSCWKLLSPIQYEMLVWMLHVETENFQRVLVPACVGVLVPFSRHLWFLFILDIFWSWLSCVISAIFTNYLGWYLFWILLTFNELAYISACCHQHPSWKGCMCVNEWASAAACLVHLAPRIWCRHPCHHPSEPTGLFSTSTRAQSHHPSDETSTSA